MFKTKKVLVEKIKRQQQTIRDLEYQNKRHAELQNKHIQNLQNALGNYVAENAKLSQALNGYKSLSKMKEGK